MEYLEHLLASLAGTLKLILESSSILCILVGLLKTGQLAWRQNQHRFPSDRRLLQNYSPDLATIRLNFGRWLSLALEFQLGADIANTTVAPSFEALGKLGITALIRTFLNFFLSKELAEEMQAIEQSHQLSTTHPNEN